MAEYSIRKIGIRVGADRITYAKDINPVDTGFERESFRLELSMARIFHRVLNLPRPTNVFEKDDYAVLGKSLYKMLLDYKSAREFLDGEFQAVLADPHFRCRIFLSFESAAQELAQLPWEYLSLPFSGKQRKSLAPFIAADELAQFDFIRSLFPDAAPEAFQFNPAPDQKIGVIVVTANAIEKDFKISVDKMTEMVVRMSAKYEGRLDFYQIEQPEKNTFAEKLEECIQSIAGPYVIHYFGHSQVEKNAGLISFVDQNEKVQWIEDVEFAAYFKDMPAASRPLAVFLQACASGQVTGYDAHKWRGVAASLAMQKIPAVVGMQNDVTEEDSFAFYSTFYNALMDGEDLAAAVTSGRKYLGCNYSVNEKNNYSTNMFGTPVLFLSVTEPFQLVHKKESLSEKTVVTKRCEKCKKVYPNTTMDTCRKFGCGGRLVPVIPGQSFEKDASTIIADAERDKERLNIDSTTPTPSTPTPTKPDAHQ